MVKITEELLRKSSEHNEGVISTLEEVALHQRDIEKLEYLDKWCRDLKILDLTSNLIPKIESLGRLKKLEYLKLGLNNIEKVENLEGCESLVKVDLTMNFIGELTSVQSLAGLHFLRELYLTGNPCTRFENYRQYVVGTLPQLEKLDGVEVTKSERILALQVLAEVKEGIRGEQEAYQRKREKDKTNVTAIEQDYLFDEGLSEDERNKRFWQEKTEYTPECRQRAYQFQESKKPKEAPKQVETPRLVNKDGRRLNVNQPKLQFLLTEDQSGGNLVLDVAAFRYMSTQECSVDVQPSFVQVVVRGKVLQVVLPDEVSPDRSTAERSTASGRLIITMPRIDPEAHIKSALPKFNAFNPRKLPKTGQTASMPKRQQQKQLQQPQRKLLEVDPSCHSKVNIQGIYHSSTTTPWRCSAPPQRRNSASFVDDPSVPPLV